MNLVGWRRFSMRSQPPPVGATLLEATGVHVRLGGRPVLAGAGLRVAAGEFVALVGPNGAGKSTLLGALAGDLHPSAGQVTIGGHPVGRWKPHELARRRAVLPQQVTLSFPFTVAEVVRMGRAPWRGVAEADDERIVAAAMAETEVGHLAGRAFRELSGGERARASLARVLAQDTPLLLLDEPTASLDIHHQEAVLGVVRGRVDAGHGAVVVLHDLGAAAAWADRIVLVAGGRTVADGPPAEVLDAEVLSSVYRHEVDVLAHPLHGTPLVVPRRCVVAPHPHLNPKGST